MDETTDKNRAVPPAGSLRLPSKRVAALLAAAMLGVGIAIGAAVAPAPSASLGASQELARQLPLLLAHAEAQRAAAARASAAATSTASLEPPAKSPEPTPTRSRVRTPSASSTGASEQQSGGEGSSGSKKAAGSKLPAVTNVWLIELSGSGFDAALADASAAPYTTGTLLGEGTLLKNWSAVDANAFASETVLAEPPAEGATPPLLRTIVQPPCPEGAAGVACAPETPGELTAADEFLKATLATITSTETYKEHGLVVITFAAVAVPTQSELPAGSSVATLSYQPPAGALLLSPFVRVGQRSAAKFDATSPKHSLEALLRRT
jgi:hypothetical protein